MEVSGQPHTLDTLLPGKDLPLSKEQVSGWAPESIWTQ